MRNNLPKNGLSLFAAALLSLPMSAHAYIDPGSGSHILQVLLVVFFGAMASIKIFWARIKEIISGLFSKEKKPKEDEE